MVELSLRRRLDTTVTQLKRELKIFLQNDLAIALNEVRRFVGALIPAVHRTLSAGKQHDLRLVLVERSCVVLSDDVPGGICNREPLCVACLETYRTDKGNYRWSFERGQFFFRGAALDEIHRDRTVCEAGVQDRPLLIRQLLAK